MGRSGVRRNCGCHRAGAHRPSELDATNCPLARSRHAPRPRREGMLVRSPDAPVRRAHRSHRRGGGRAHRPDPLRRRYPRTSSYATATATSTFPITYDDVERARERLAPYLTVTPLRPYPLLDAAVGLTLFAKHENHQPTGSFKVRNGLSFMTALSPSERGRGVVAASTGNHGQGIAFGAALVGTTATICVPCGNNPEKNAAMRAWGATVVEEGRDYDESVQAMERIAREEGRVLAHSTNDARIIAGAGTMTLEIVEQAGDDGIDALVLAVGGGSQAVGALTVAKRLA